MCAFGLSEFHIVVKLVFIASLHFCHFKTKAITPAKLASLAYLPFLSRAFVATYICDASPV